MPLEPHSSFWPATPRGACREGASDVLAAGQAGVTRRAKPRENGAVLPRDDVVEKVLAGLALAICTVMLFRMVIGAPRRARLNAAFRRGWVRAKGVWQWRATRKEAERVAEEAIRRAREGEWDGNVYKPKSFRKPPKNKMH
jgi:hypothetical protein